MSIEKSVIMAVKRSGLDPIRSGEGIIIGRVEEGDLGKLLKLTVGGQINLLEGAASRFVGKVDRRLQDHFTLGLQLVAIMAELGGEGDYGNLVEENDTLVWLGGEAGAVELHLTGLACVAAVGGVGSWRMVGDDEFRKTKKDPARSGVFSVHAFG